MNFLFLILYLLFSNLALANDKDTTKSDTSYTPNPKAHLYTLGIGMGLSGGSITWKYNTAWTGTFRQANEGFFGYHTYSGGADKLGHMYTDFVLVRGLYWVYKEHKYNKQDALLYSFLIGSSTRTIMEVMDGFTTYKYSSGDLLFNMIGSTTSSLLLLNDTLADTFSLSWSYLPSKEVWRGTHDASNFSIDYGGAVFSFDTNLKQFRKLVQIDDESLDNYSIGINYFTRSYLSDKDVKSRNIGLNLSYNLYEKVDNFYAKSILRYYKPFFTYGGVNYNFDHKTFRIDYGLSYLY